MLDSSVALELHCRDIGDLKGIASEVADFAGEICVWLVQGSMGVGKTTFIKEVCRYLGSADYITSPTFNIINEYRSAEGRPLFHFDFYRLEAETEALDLGVEEYFESGEFCFVEWPEKIPSLYPVKYLYIKITYGSGQQRVFQLLKNE